MITRVIGAGLVICLAAAGCSAPPNQAAAQADSTSMQEAVAGLSTSLGSLKDLGPLPSDSPEAGYESGGGGLAGEPWPVWGLPGARSSNDPGIAVDKMAVASTVSLRPIFTAAPGKGTYQFVVMDTAGKTTLWDSGQVSSSNQDCVINASQASCTLPSDKVGLLTNGSTYRLVTTADGVTSPRLFQVQVPQGTTGGTGAVAMGRQYGAAVANLQVGLAFSTSDQGAAAGTQVTEGGRWGLPAGWQWKGPNDDFVTINRVPDATQYSGFTQLLTVNTLAHSQTLGCKAPTGSTTAACGDLSTDLAGIGFSAVINPDGTVVVTNQATGQNWTFDANNQLIGSAAQGTAPMSFSYRTVPGATSPVLDTMSVPATDWAWKFYYSGDTQCETANLPNGFVSPPAGYACGWGEPAGDRSLIFYTQPEGAKVPRLSRVVHTPASCEQWSSCDLNQLGVFDLGWDSKNRITSQRQDAIVDATVMGWLEDDDQDFWARSSYDELGRVSKLQQPKLKPDGTGDSGGVGGATVTYTYAPADPAFAPATHQVTSTSSVPGAPTHTQIVAVDDIGRPQVQQDADGVQTKFVWDADLQLKYGRIVGDAVTGATYDAFNRQTAAYSGSNQSFDLSKCAPAAENRSNDSCKPVTDKANAALASHTYTYDLAEATGNGLRASWFDNPDFSGNPADTTELNQATSKGFSIQPPAKLGDDWSVTLGGGVVLDKAATWDINVNIPAGLATGATLFVDGEICDVLSPDQTRMSCTFTSDGSTYPIQLDLAHAKGSTKSGQVTIGLQQDEFSPAVVDNQHFLPIWAAKASDTTTDHNPDGSAVTYVTQYKYDDPDTLRPTSTKRLPVRSTAGQPAALTTSTEYAPNGFGGAITTATSSSSGSKRVGRYWGLKDTPSSANLPNLSQIPAELHDVPQRGQLQVQTSPGGQQKWNVYDKYGIGVCEASVQQGNDPVWSCQQRDGRGRLVHATMRGQDGQAEITLDYQYKFDTNHDQSPFIAQVTRTESGRSTTEITREWPGGITDSYTAADGSTSTYAYEPTGSIQRATTEIPNTAAVELAKTAGATVTTPASGSTSVTYNYTYDELGRAHSISDESGELARINYDSSDPRQIDSYDYFGGKIGQELHYDQYDRPTSRTWKLDGGELSESTTATAAGRTVTNQFDNIAEQYRYDGFNRLLQADTKVDQTTHSFTYAWDEDSQRTCAAVDIPNPQQAECAKLTGATTFEYKNNLLVSSSSPTSKIPAGTLTKDGSFRQIGAQTYEFDAARQLSKATTTAPADAAAAASPSAAPEPSTAAPSASQSAAPSASSPAASSLAAPSAPASPSASPSAPGTSDQPHEVSFLRDSANRQLAQISLSDKGTSATSYVYGQGGNGVSPLAFVSANGSVTRLTTLPGGLALRGDTPIISSATGTATVKLTAEGARTGQPASVWGPFGEAVTVDPAMANAPASAGWRGQSTVLDNNLMVLGVRGYRADTATFLQADPIAGGSGTFNEHAYVAGDPINTSDLTGTQLMDDTTAEVIGNLVSMALEFFVLDGVYHLINSLPDSIWTIGGGSLGKFLTFAANAGVNMGMSIALEAAITIAFNGSFHMSGPALVFAGISAAISGYLGSMYATIRNRGVTISNWFKSLMPGAETVASAQGALKTASDVGQIAIAQAMEGNVAEAISTVVGDEAANTIINTAQTAVRVGKGTAIGAVAGGVIFGPAGAVVGGTLGGYIGAKLGSWMEYFSTEAEWIDADHDPFGQFVG